MVTQAYGAVGSPPVILEEGTAGSCTICANETSAKVSVAAPAPVPTYYPSGYSVLSGNWRDLNWDKRVKITLDNNDVDSALSNFPLLVYLSNSSGRNDDDVSFIFDELQSDANRKKIAVTTSDGTTQCHVEIEKWDDTSQKAWLWVKVPSISNTKDTELYLYYDRDHADNTVYVGDTGSTAAQNVWDSSFKGVWHLSETSGGVGAIKDSTSNNNVGTDNGSPTFNATGRIDSAISFDGIDDYINMSNSASLQFTNSLTIEAWINLQSFGSGTDVDIVLRKGEGNPNDYQLAIHDQKIELMIEENDGAGLDGSTNLAATTWYHLTGTWNGSIRRVYLNGSEDGSGSKTGNIIPDTRDIYVGGRLGTDLSTGVIDEVRASNTTRGAAWIKASYESGRDDLLDFGSEELSYHVSGTVPGSVENVDSDYLIIRSVASGTTASPYNPFDYNLLGSTQNVSGGISDLETNNEFYMTFSSYYSGTNIQDFVENNMSDVDSSGNKGTHSNFPSQQAGPDSMNDTLTEEYITVTNTTYNFAGISSPSGSHLAEEGEVDVSDPTDPAPSYEDGTYVVGLPSRDLTGITGYVNREATSAEYDLIEAQDANRWTTTDPEYGDNAWFLAEFFISESKASITQLDIKFVGYQAAATDKLWVSVWNYYYSVHHIVDYFQQAGSDGTFATTITNTTIIDHLINDANGLITVVAFNGDTSDSIVVNYVEVVVHYSGTSNYELDLEVQWTSVDFDETNEELCIYGGIMGTENITVDVWYNSAWQNVLTDLTSGWNNVPVSSYLDSSTFTIRFKGANETGDSTEDSWNIDVTLLHVWSPEYTTEVEFTGSSNTYTWTQLEWAIDSAWTIGSVSVTLQLYDYFLGDYPASGNGYMSYTSSATANTDETKSQNITVNPTRFKNATGYWKMKVKGVKAIETQFDFKTDWIEFKPTYYSEYTVSAEFLFSDMTTNTPTQLNFTVVSQYNITSVNVTIQVWNYSSSAYVTSGEGYSTYTSTGTNVTKTLSINTNPQFYTSGGYTKIKVTGVNSSTTEFQQKINQIKLTYEYNASSTYDYVLKAVNQVANNWTVNLQVYDNSSISRLSSLNISIHDGTSSNQIAVSGGSIAKSEGEPYDLPGGSGSPIYISISNLQATTSGTSYLYVYLKILVPDTSTYLLYIITFEIT